MRNLPRLLALLLVLASAVAGAVVLNFSVHYEFVNCAAGGSAAQTLPPGQYLFRATGSDLYICAAATCATGGEVFPQNSVLYWGVPLGPTGTGVQYSCRSAASTGTATFTGAQ